MTHLYELVRHDYIELMKDERVRSVSDKELKDWLKCMAKALEWVAPESSDAVLSLANKLEHKPTKGH